MGSWWVHGMVMRRWSSIRRRGSRGVHEKSEESMKQIRRVQKVVRCLQYMPGEMFLTPADCHYLLHILSVGDIHLLHVHNSVAFFKLLKMTSLLQYFNDRKESLITKIVLMLATLNILQYVRLNAYGLIFNSLLFVWDILVGVV
jgi:hypothetical protein